MYIEKIKIDKFRVLDDIEIQFQVPQSATADRETGNVVNVIAGVNGTGKTSLLEALFSAISNPYNYFSVKKNGVLNVFPFGEINKDTWRVLQDKISDFNQKHNNIAFSYNEPRIIFLPSQQNFKYKALTQLGNNYMFLNKIEIDKILGAAEFYIKEYILSAVIDSSIADPQQRMEQAVNSFNDKFLNANLLTRLSRLSKEQFNRPLFKNALGQEVTIDLLSDGEKQLYGRVISLMILNPHNSMILIDEPEISLHPAWQQKIIQIYSKIGRNNQFIVATHSPQIIASVPYQNRILLRKEQNKIIPIHLNQPPSGLDVNTILSEIMGASPIPSEIVDLHRQYRALVENKKEQSPEALAIRQKLSEESEHSQFMQEMNFLIDLRDL